ncbi:phage associated [Tenacibaculum phage pT24]|uniref:Phage associated n=1 Tax=Tenacibaculum phage pT24 TaxID=1880590 RepID=A0A1B4XWP6_9CAUD|nr:phage associated [Tenacibaculum phage pT24]BAV39238.1 phage associated [Tenacibaculum phage pT24]
MDVIQYLTEALKVGDFNVDDWLKKGQGIKRIKMPQLPKENFPQFLMHFARKYKIKEMKVPVSKLKPIQCEVNMEKVKKMAKKGIGLDRTYLVSKDYGIADGTHGVLSVLLSNPDHEVKVYRTNLPCRKMIEILNKMKGTHNADINENEDEFFNIDFEWK